MTALWGERRTDVLSLVATVAMGALAAACASGGESYQAEAMQASDKGDLKTATSLAQKEVDKYSAADQCSSTTNYNCGTLALAYSSLAEYQIRSGDTAAGERSFDRAKGALQRVPKDNKPSAVKNGMPAGWNTMKCSTTECRLAIKTKKEDNVSL